MRRNGFLRAAVLLAGLALWAGAMVRADTPETTTTQTTTTQATTTQATTTQTSETPIPYRRDTPLKPPDNNPGGGLAKLMGYALIILLLGGVAMVVARKYAPGRAPARGKTVQVLENTYLGPRKTLHLVQVGDRRLLLSSTRDQVRMLADVTGVSAPELPIEEANDPS